MWNFLRVALVFARLFVELHYIAQKLGRVLSDRPRRDLVP